MNKANKNYVVSITLLEDLHTGTGTGNLYIDATQAKDAQGKPVIDRHHFRGVLRDNALRLKELGVIDQATISALFGETGGQQRQLDCSSLATTANKDSLNYWESSARQINSRLPEDHTLHRIEYIKAGTVFTGEIHLNNVEQKQIEAFEKILQFTTRLGSERTRGSGQIKIDYRSKQQSSQKSFAPLAANANKIRLLLVNKEALCIPTSGHAGNIIRSESYIPGRTLFAALCAKAATVSDEALKSLFTDQLRIGNAYPIPDEIATQNTRELYCLPMPQNIYSIKQAASTTEPMGHWPHWAKPLDHATRLNVQRDIDKFTDRGGQTAKRPKGELYLIRDEKGDWQRYRQPLTIRMRNRRGDPCATVLKADTDLFSEQRIPANTHFLVDIECHNADLRSRIHSWLALTTLTIGRAKAPVTVVSMTSSITALESSKCDSALTITASSDWIIRAHNLGYLTHLEQASLLEAFEINEDQQQNYANLTLHAIQDSETQGSFNYASGLPRRPFHVIRRGSSYRFTGDKQQLERLYQLLSKRDRPIGERIMEGYGQYCINLPYTIGEETKEPSATDNEQDAINNLDTTKNEANATVTTESSIDHEQIRSEVDAYLQTCKAKAKTTPPPSRSQFEHLLQLIPLETAEIYTLAGPFSELLQDKDFDYFYRKQGVNNLLQTLDKIKLPGKTLLDIKKIHCFLRLLCDQFFNEAS